MEVALTTSLRLRELDVSSGIFTHLEGGVVFIYLYCSIYHDKHCHCDAGCYDAILVLCNAVVFCTYTS